jgi:hypothetical protein
VRERRPRGKQDGIDRKTCHPYEIGGPKADGKLGRERTTTSPSRRKFWTIGGGLGAPMPANMMASSADEVRVFHSY